MVQHLSPKIPPLCALLGPWRVPTGEQCQRSYLAHGLIFSASPRLIQNPAPPVANQKCTGCCERGEATVLRPTPANQGAQPSPN